MSFCPLPASFLEDLQRAGQTTVLELGSGDGTLTGVLRDHGITPLTLDRRRGPGIAAMVCGDALQPPLQKSRFRVVVVANLLRHLWPRIRRSGPRSWAGLLAPGGCLWILEDEPLASPPPARNYRDLQELMFRIDPGQRQPLLPSAEFRDRRRHWRWPGRWCDGMLENQWPLSAARVLAWLQTGAAQPGGTVAGLMAAIEQDGLSCGRCWWARWEAEATR